ncbi:MAG TPA: hypothetical protein VMD76_02040 [Candidatus Sulfotelmatobacter sp.]|nr:hypothetical protein [Candidatus Sulfotelmatobacter sp.]
MVELSPRGNSRVLRMRAIPEMWTTSSPYANDGGFLQSWFEDNSNPAARGVNWGAVSGMVLSVGLSAAFWTGVGLAIERILH